ncbi:hypothetical protein N7454_003830 [Penicillium verhagenii]|nr:hypothetical protein N7454_003830 [Penicillium verhagenii]
MAGDSKIWNNRIPGMFFGHCVLTPRIIDYEYSGSGTVEDPYIISWLPDDVENPMNFREVSKWSLNLLAALSAFTVSLASSAYSGGLTEIIASFAITKQIAALGISVFVIGFAVGPLLWAPLSEIYGRRYVFIVSSAALTATLAGTARAQNIETLLILRFLAGSLGSAPISISGG